MLRIIIKLNDSVTKEFKTDQKEIIIGRDPGCDIQIENIAVSREHARIVKGPNDYLIEDLNSSNGVFINGRKINKKFLKTGEEIVIGKHTLQIVMEEASAIRKKRNIKSIDNTYRMGPGEYKKVLKR
jgi:pSer/pThr/pTyr-binding forkhead associated (FHA) protein